MNLKVGDKVRIKENLSECEFGYNRYMEEFAGKKATVIRTFGKGGIELDIDKQVWNWSENVLELIEKNDNMNVKIEEGNKVNESDLKDSGVESITIGQALQSICDIPPQIKINSDKIKEVEDDENDPVNPFMEEYEKIVNETVKLCKRKNTDYGSSVQDTYEKFGDISYLVRITDKYNRICSLLQNGKAEVENESITDTIVDLANYCFLWASSRNLKVEGKNNE
nr:MAG TPA: Nucleotide modification associated domain 1 [Caudoviricetes sp.]